MSTRGEIRLTEEILSDLGFKKVSYTDEDKEYYHYELSLTRNNNYGDLLLITNASDEEDFPIVKLFGADEYDFLFAEPIVVLMNILQANCIVPDFILDQQNINTESNDEPHQETE